jgi:hypothetical protein
METSQQISTEVHDTATDGHATDPQRDINAQNPLTLTFAFVAGLGLTLMIAAAAIGVIQGAEADSDLLGLLFLGGTAGLIIGGVAWAGIVRPWEAFPSVTEGFYDPPPTAEKHDEPTDDTAHA